MKTKNNSNKTFSTKRKCVFAIFLALTIFIIYFIFSHSAKTSEESIVQSAGVSKVISQIINKIFGTRIIAEDISGKVRTLAHFSEFSALSFSISGVFESFFGVKGFKGFKKLQNIWLLKRVPKHSITVFLLTFATAVIDETIQIFYEGRAFQLIDVFIDSLGGITGILFFTLVSIPFIKNSTTK